MENYRFIVTDSDMQETVLAKLLDNGYNVKIDDEIPEADLNCFTIWADGLKNCVFTKSTGGDNTKVITDKNLDWFLKQL